MVAIHSITPYHLAAPGTSETTSDEEAIEGDVGIYGTNMLVDSHVHGIEFVNLVNFSDSCPYDDCTRHGEEIVDVVLQDAAGQQTVLRITEADLLPITASLVRWVTKRSPHAYADLLDRMES